MVNWSAVAAIAAICGVLATIIGVAFTSGRLTEKIRVIAASNAERGRVQEEHRNILDEHTLQIDRLQQWRNGFNAAANVSGQVRAEEHG